MNELTEEAVDEALKRKKDYITGAKEIPIYAEQFKTMEFKELKENVETLKEKAQANSQDWEARQQLMYAFAAYRDAVYAHSSSIFQKQLGFHNWLRSEYEKIKHLINAQPPS